MLKHICKVAISAVLIAAICAVSCLNAFAASKQARYLSDIVLCSAESADAAKAELTSMGYKLLSTQNLNVTLSDGVYIGYKTTADPDEAITDLAVMNMFGNYSFTDYEVLLEKMQEDVEGTVNGLVPMITAYRDNYNAQNGLAVEVHTLLNRFYEDDSKQGMGDYLLTCNLKNTEDLTKVFMQGYSSFIMNIQQLLFLAGENDGDKTWIEKMAAADPDAVIDLYMDSYPTPNRAFSAMAADFGQGAEDIAATWDVFYETLQGIDDAYMTEDGSVDKAEVTAVVEKAGTAAEAEVTADMTAEQQAEGIAGWGDAVTGCNSIADMNLAVYLSGLTYGDGTMLDFFMRPMDEVDEFELYTLAYYMGESLTAQVGNVGLQNAVNRVLVDGGSAADAKFTELNTAFAQIEQISVYDGVDRSLFENGVALTGATVEKYVSSGKSWSDDLFSRLFVPTEEYKWADYFAFYVLPTVCSYLIFSGLFAANSWINTILAQAGSDVTKAATSSVEGYLLYNNAELIQTEALKDNIISYLAYGRGFVGQSNPLCQALAVMRCAFFVFSVVMTVVSIVMLFETIFNAEETVPAYEPIPNHIVDTVSTKYGDDYIAYNYAENTAGSAADLNNYVSKNGWLVLYYTKDPMAGAPLTADIKVVAGSADMPLDYENLALFGQENAVNIAAEDYTGVKDTAGGIYLYFCRGDYAAAGSAVTGGYAAIAIGAGGAAGAALGLIGAKLTQKKKKKAEA